MSSESGLTSVRLSNAFVIYDNDYSYLWCDRLPVRLRDAQLSEINGSPHVRPLAGFDHLTMMPVANVPWYENLQVGSLTWFQPTHIYTSRMGGRVVRFSP
jgi:hypothetical protein